MIAHLDFKNADPWSGHKVYENCRHYISTYIKRNGLTYTGLDHDNNLRERLEREIGLEPGALKANSSFWDAYNIIVGEGGLYIDTSTPKGELDYYFAQGHKRIQFGLKDINPGADYILIQAEEEAKETNLKNKLKRKAITEFDKLTPNEMRKVLRIYGHNSTNISAEVAESTLYVLVEEDPKKFIEVWINNTHKETIFLIEEACGKQILRKDKTVYKYGSDVIGYSLEEAIDYLENPANSSLLVTIKAQIDGKDLSFGTKKVENTEGNSQFAKIMQEIKEEDVSDVDKVTEEEKVEDKAEEIKVSKKKTAK